MYAPFSPARTTALGASLIGVALLVGSPAAVAAAPNTSSWTISSAYQYSFTDPSANWYQSPRTERITISVPGAPSNVTFKLATEAKTDGTPNWSSFGNAHPYFGQIVLTSEGATVPERIFVEIDDPTGNKLWAAETGAIFAAKPTTIMISSALPTAVPAGTRIRVSGTITSQGKPLNHYVFLEDRRYLPSSRIITDTGIGYAAAGTTGAWSTIIMPSWKTSLAVTYCETTASCANDPYAPSIAHARAVIRTFWRPVVERPTAVLYHGRSATWAVSVPGATGPMAHVIVRLQYLVGLAWKTVASATTSSNGNARLQAALPKAPGKLSLRVFALAKNVASGSGTTYSTDAGASNTRIAIIR